MSIELCVLGSGSSGNSSVVRIDGGAMLIDAGFGPRATARRLTGTGVEVADLRHLVLTHLDHDHFKPAWLPVIRRCGMGLWCHEQHLPALLAARSSSGVRGRDLHREGWIRTFADQPFVLPLEQTGARIHPVRLAHDRTGSVGFAIDNHHARLGYATDIGRATPALIRTLTDADILAIEANYDPPMQARSGRPRVLRERITGGRGHLSNRQSFQAVRAMLQGSRRPPEHVVLLHLSRQCNRPEIARRVFAADAMLGSRLCITSQSRPTPWLRVAPSTSPTFVSSFSCAEQMMLW